MESVFLKLLNMSIAAGWLILAVVILRLLLKKAPKSIRCVLWALAGIRLVCPFSFESLLSLVPSAETVSPDILYAQSPTIHSGIAMFNAYVNPVISESLAPAAGSGVSPIQAAAHIASVVWMAGMAALLLYAAISYFSLRRKVRTAVLLRDNVWQSENVASPFVLGIVRPRIYLPFYLSGEDAEHVVAHENAHIGRRDHWLKPVGFLLLTVYWFNPLIWLAYVLLCRDIELACDERVVKRMSADGKKAYSETLLMCSVPHRAVAACPLAFGEAGVKQRIRNVLNYKKPAFLVIAVALVSCLAVAVCFLTNPKDDAALTTYAQSGQKLSELSEDECLAFLASRGIEVPDDLAPEGIGAFVKEVVSRAEEYPQSPGGYSYTVTMEFTEAIRKAVNEYYAVDGGAYYIQGAWTAEDAAVYVFKDCFYMSPMSSLCPFGGTGCRYLLGKDGFAVVDEETGETIRSFTDIGWNWRTITDEEWSALFSTGPGAPDISAYETRHMLELSDTWRLLDMDGGLWLMRTNGGGIVWSVYELTPEGSNALTLQDVLSLSALGNALTWENLRPFAYEDTGSGRYLYAFPIGESWRLVISSGSGFGSGGTIGDAVMLEYLPDGGRVDIREGDAAAFIAEKESARTGNPVVFSGCSLCTAVPAGDDGAGSIVFNPAHSETYMVPFSVYVNGEEMNGGLYSIRDADTGEALDFISPSGLSAQTYLLQNAQAGHRYEITLRIYDGDMDGSYVFGIYVN